ncbi:O-antigen ligase family protein [Acetobacterium fimetarium]|nr:O-antigen ligase family protein [Acetobacterium fimetarium]
MLSNSLAAILIGLIWLENMKLRKKLVFNNFLFVFLLFIMACMISVFYSIDPGESVAKVQTLVLVYILMVSLINYMDSFEKIYFMMKCFAYSGFVASCYILVNADFTTLVRYGSILGNVNAIGMVVGISSVFCFYFIIKSEKKTMKVWYFLILLTNFIVILLTGSRKALLFITMSIIFLLIFQEKGKLRSKLKTVLVCAVIIAVVFYAINNVPVFYDIIGKRMTNMFDFVFGGGTSEGSINVRSGMIFWGWEWFKERPLFGYGIDNYKLLYNSVTSGAGMYSHNNIIELLVGTGIVGAVLYYLAAFIVIKDIIKASKLVSKTLCYSFFVVIVGYMFMSVALVFYYQKHISIMLALGSVIYRLAKNEKQQE